MHRINIFYNRHCFVHHKKIYSYAISLPQIKYKTDNMASTRFRDDTARVEEQVRYSTFACGYMINAPGTGTQPAYLEDPHFRLQKWGANYMTNSVDLESSLKGIRPLTRDCLGVAEYTNFDTNSQPIQYPTNSCMYIEQSRVIAPAWEIRDAEARQTDYEPLLDPQENVTRGFQHNVSTRILEKDTFNPKSLLLSPLQSSDLLPNYFTK